MTILKTYKRIRLFSQRIYTAAEKRFDVTFGNSGTGDTRDIRSPSK